MSVFFDLRSFVIWCIVKDVDRDVTDCHGVQWLETISRSSWYCSCDITSFHKFLLIVKTLFFLDIKVCNVVYVAAAVIE